MCPSLRAPSRLRTARLPAASAARPAGSAGDAAPPHLLRPRAGDTAAAGPGPVPPAARRPPRGPDRGAGALTFLLAPPRDTLGLVLNSPSKLNIFTAYPI